MSIIKNIFPLGMALSIIVTGTASASASNFKETSKITPPGESIQLQQKYLTVTKTYSNQSVPKQLYYNSGGWVGGLTLISEEAISSSLSRATYGGYVSYLVQ